MHFSLFRATCKMPWVADTLLLPLCMPRVPKSAWPPVLSASSLESVLEKHSSCFSVLSYKNILNNNNLRLNTQSCSDVYVRSRANVLRTLITLLPGGCPGAPRKRRMEALRADQVAEVWEVHRCVGCRGPGKPQLHHPQAVLGTGCGAWDLGPSAG